MKAKNLVIKLKHFLVFCEIMSYFISLRNQIILDKHLAFLCVCLRVKRETKTDDRRKSMNLLWWLLLIIIEGRIF